jgi:hypothetical protein
MAVREVVHLLSSEPFSFGVYTNHIVTGIEFDVKGSFVSTISTPVEQLTTDTPRSP